MNAFLKGLQAAWRTLAHSLGIKIKPDVYVITGYADVVRPGEQRKISLQAPIRYTGKLIAYPLTPGAFASAPVFKDGFAEIVVFHNRAEAADIKVAVYVPANGGPP